MNFAAAILYAMSSSVLLGIALGFARGGLNRGSAIVALLGGLLVAVFSLWNAKRSAPIRRPRGWEWFAVGLFAWFSVRAFLWLVTIEGDEIKTVVWNNCGDLSLHLGFIRYLANGAPFWPESPIFVGGKLTYSIGSDLFNSLLVLLGIDVYRGLILVGLVCSAVAGMALWRWGRAFTVMGFLCNGGFAAVAILLQHQLAGAVTGNPVGFPDADKWPLLIDFQSNVAWKNIPLTMFITQRGFLYALPAGLLLLCSWRARFFAGQGENEWRMPVWGEVLLYASMPIFHIHTFVALSFMLGAFLIARPEVRKPLGVLIGAAFVPATILVWLTLGMFQSAPAPEWGDMFQIDNPPPRPSPDVLGWKPGWMSDDNTTREGFAALGGTPERAAMLAPFAQFAYSMLARFAQFAYFWTLNFGILPILAIALVAVVLRMTFQRTIRLRTLFACVFGAMFLSAFLSGFSFWKNESFFDQSANPSGITFTPMLAAVFAAIAGAMRPPSNGARTVRALLFGLAAVLAICASIPATTAITNGLRLNALPLIFATVALVGILIRLSRNKQQMVWPAVFVLPALYLFFLCCNVKFAEWDWDNTKIMIWAYLIVLPFIWDLVIARMSFWTKVFVCELLFFSGFLSLYGGLRPDMPGRTIASVSQLEIVERAVKDIPINEPILSHPSHDHPLLLIGRRVALGYPGHVSSHGLNPERHKNHINAIMRGWGDWRILAAELGCHYIYWGEAEAREYGGFDQPWRHTKRVYVTNGVEIYDLDIPSVPQGDVRE